MGPAVIYSLGLIVDTLGAFRLKMPQGLCLSGAILTRTLSQHYDDEGILESQYSHFETEAGGRVRHGRFVLDPSGIELMGLMQPSGSESLAYLQSTLAV